MSKEELTNDLFQRACLLADNEILTIAYHFDSYNVGQITLSNTVSKLKFKTRLKIQTILNSLTGFIDCYEVIETAPQ